MHYFAGEAQSSNLYAHYNLDKNVDGIEVNDIR